MKIISYQAKLSYADDGISVEFPDLDGCFSFGDTLEEALFNAREALDLYLENAIDPKWKVPAPKARKGSKFFWVTPSLEIAIPLTIRYLRELSNLTQPEIARRVNMKVQQYQKLEYPKKSNPTTKSLISVADELGYEIEFKKKVVA
ncbi:MAG: type II toxin-antitoxin system HicB family antitoxin [Bacteriovorax sp.]|nr:type II toxin-antitoxin system HicB family antitoxin [Bacteriovorax sp.]